MKCKVGLKLRKGSKVTLAEAFNKIPKNTQGHVESWTYDRFWDGIYYTRHFVRFEFKGKEVIISIPTKLLKK